MLAVVLAFAGTVTAGGAPSSSLAQGAGLVGRATAVAEEGAEPRAVVALAGAMADSGNVGWVPYLVDLLDVVREEPVAAGAAEALWRLTGVAPPGDLRDAYVAYGTWMYDHEPLPVPGYVAWKARLYAGIDPAFEPLVRSVHDPVLAAKLQWGGIRRGGIVALDMPQIIPVAGATYMIDSELTFGAVVGGEARAYPHRILDRHELVDDTLGGEPVALVDCTLCRTGVLYSRRIGGRVLDFETSGLLLGSNKVMVDRQTNSLWVQLTGEAIAGPLAGRTLERFPLTVTRWGAWTAEHPDGTVLTIPTGIPHDYEPGLAYRDYFESPDLRFPARTAPGAFAPKEQVVTLAVGDRYLAVGLTALAAAGPRVLSVGGVWVLVVPTSAGARAYGGARPGDELLVAAAGDAATELTDGRRLGRLVSGQSYWFAWHAAHPDTSWWPGR